jgi:hypothetical protein
VGPLALIRHGSGIWMDEKIEQAPAGFLRGTILPRGQEYRER